MGRLDLTGERYGRLLVLNEEPSNDEHRKWRCICDCGCYKTVSQSDLRTGKTTSCGCYHKEMIGKLNYKHGGTSQQERLYTIWRNMKQRCENPKNKAYKWYGDKGISICDGWRDYSVFREWATANGYADGLTIDRIDSNGPYSPQNCRWVTNSENSKRVLHIESARFLCVNGQRKNESQWAKEIGVTQAAISGWISKYGETEACKKIETLLG